MSTTYKCVFFILLWNILCLIKIMYIIFQDMPRATVAVEVCAHRANGCERQLRRYL